MNLSFFNMLFSSGLKIAAFTITEGAFLIFLLAAILLIALGVFVGIKIGKNSVKKANKDQSVVGTGYPLLDEAIEFAGYAYDEKQDVYYSHVEPWQKSFGYCRLYDELSPPFGIIVDSEPIYIEYNDEKWLIEFWKGQYDLASGFEIGIYKRVKDQKEIPFLGEFYRGASKDDFLHMRCVLRKNGAVMFEREDTHWWLTGFKLGDFAQPEELMMDIEITLKDEDMRNAFIEGLRNTGYGDCEIQVSKNAVYFTFDKPYSPQPYTRSEIMDKVIQAKNKLICDMFNDITCKGTTPERLRTLREKAPYLFERILTLGNPKQLGEIREAIERYLLDNLI